MQSNDFSNLAILGGGNLGRALAIGWSESGAVEPSQITVTRRQSDRIQDLAQRGIRVTSSNRDAVESADVVIVAVQPQQLAALSEEISGVLRPGEHQVVSVVSGVSIAQLRSLLGDSPVSLVRAMPNTAVAISEAMTCLCAEPGAEEGISTAETLFGLLGQTLVIQEEMMIPATALCACGVAFFLRCIRAASQGGIEIGFHPEEALQLAAQTAKGAAALLLEGERHPEREIDRVTTPRGCTIAGLNEMEHQGLSSALIRGIVTSARAAGELG